MRRVCTSPHVRAVAGFCVLAVVFAWPLPLRLATHLLGSPGGDTGLYVWNLWVFSHEAAHGHFPFFTSTIFSLDNTADLSLHNYTVLADVVAIPLLALIGIVATFNLLYLLVLVVNGYLMFLLARELKAGDRAAWLAGALFAFAPCLVARSSAHFSLVMAAPMVAFLIVLRRMQRNPAGMYGAIGGVLVACAAFCDPYYGVYCLLLAGFHLAWRHGELRLARRANRAAVPARLLECAIASVLALAVWIGVTGGGTLRPFGVALQSTTLYTPMLALSVLILARLALEVRAQFHLRNLTALPPLYRFAPFGALSCTLLMSPVLYTLGTRIADGRYVSAPVNWRSSMPGVDLLALVIPNPNNPLFRGLGADWLTHLPGGFAENVASLPVVALLAIAAAVRWAGYRLPRYWLALALLSLGLAVGPFLQFAGWNSCIPTPWTFVRYAPLIGAARAPARFMAIAMIAVAVLFALALKALFERYPARRTTLFACIGVLTLFELLPAPRPLFSARVPEIYRRIAADPREVRVLELPFGVRDGLSSYGNFSASSQFYQTFHHKPLIGGYLSRVSSARVARMRQRPILSTLMDLSEGRQVPAGKLQSVKAVAPTFIEAANLGYVVINRGSASDALRAFAIDTLNLELIGVAGERELYRPRLAVRNPPGAILRAGGSVP